MRTSSVSVVFCMLLGKRRGYFVKVHLRTAAVQPYLQCSLLVLLTSFCEAYKARDSMLLGRVAC
jgi:hypothetical protein